MEKMSFIKQLLNSKSPMSSMRVMSFIALLCACILAVYGLSIGSDLIGLTALCSAFLGSAFAGKIYQKTLENKEKE